MQTTFDYFKQRLSLQTSEDILCDKAFGTFAEHRVFINCTTGSCDIDIPRKWRFVTGCYIVNCREQSIGDMEKMTITNVYLTYGKEDECINLPLQDILQVSSIYDLFSDSLLFDKYNLLKSNPLPKSPWFDYKIRIQTNYETINPILNIRDGLIERKYSGEIDTEYMLLFQGISLPYDEKFDKCSLKLFDTTFKDGIPCKL